MTNEVWNPKKMSDRNIKKRLKYFSDTISFHYLLQLLNQLGKEEFPSIKMAEVGCGTGLFSICLARNYDNLLLFMIDNNQEVLFNCGDIFETCQVKTSIYRLFMNLDCTKEVPEHYKGECDIVFSGGLIEHFKGEEQKNVIKFHRDLLKDSGIVIIRVPNKNCFYYRLIGLIRKLTGTKLDIYEKPISVKELIKLVKDNGFRTATVFPDNEPIKDLKITARGIISAFLDLVPKIERIKSIVRRSSKDEYDPVNNVDVDKLKYYNPFFSWNKFPTHFDK